MEQEQRRRRRQLERGENRQALTASAWLVVEPQPESIARLSVTNQQRPRWHQVEPQDSGRQLPSAK